MALKAAVLGPTGYSGLELIRILLRHPEAEIAYLGSRRPERPHISAIWPCLRGMLDMRCEPIAAEEMPDDIDIAFTALPHVVAMEHVPSLRARGFKVVDISADYRLKDAAVYKKWYDHEHMDPDGLAEAAYGLTELNRAQIAGAGLVANPGCYPTSVLLGVAPLLKEGLAADAPIIADSKSGVSGAGRKPSEISHYPECNEAISAYKVAAHRHGPEMEQIAAEIACRPCTIHFVPHLAPMDRGILSTCYVSLKQARSAEELKAIYSGFYAGETFIRVRTDDSLPSTKDVWGTNFCDIAVRAAGDTAIVISAIDNLVKGASGQAVQNMNVMFGLDEEAGLL